MGAGHHSMPLIPRACEEGTDSARMALELKDLGYSDDKIKVLEGGLIKWDELGYPIIKQEIPR